MGTSPNPIDQVRRAIPPEMAFGRWRAPDGWLHRRFDRSAPAGAVPRGSLLFQAGRADFVEKYLESIDHFHRAGWVTSGFDWRGQGGSGRLSGDATLGHATSLDPLVDDLAAFVAEWTAATPPPHAIVAHSMGGNLVLRMLARGGSPIDAAALVAPMLGFATAPLPSRLVLAATGIACRLGYGERAALRAPADSAERHRRRMRILTGSAERYADEEYWLAAQPDLAIGAPSWGWLAAAQASMRRLAAPGAIEAIAAPVLLIGATHDRLVSAAAIRRTAARLLHGTLRLYDDAAHELLREADPVRRRTLDAIDAFLDLHAPRRR